MCGCVEQESCVCTVLTVFIHFLESYFVCLFVRLFFWTCVREGLGVDVRQPVVTKSLLPVILPGIVNISFGWSRFCLLVAVEIRAS